ncbi:hypothetical protein, partial [Variovorax paradoxus]|uniref:hypothetical protein n=1 Tax=Variovorax paradoxus TaxID=34073 RepID=UPI001AEA68D8
MKSAQHPPPALPQAFLPPNPAEQRGPARAALRHLHCCFESADSPKGPPMMKKLKLVMVGNGMAGVRTLEELLKL